ncbi:MAG: hypothetical protein ABH852_02340 [Methanobacteriota archaeon]
MQIDQFYDRIQDHPRLTCNGFVEGKQIDDDYLVIQDSQTGDTFKVLVETILAGEWDTLEQILTGRREALVLEHMTRIVGYFSKVKNWNKSKLGELRDRQAGDYRIDKPKPEIVETPRESAPLARQDLVATA